MRARFEEGSGTVAGATLVMVTAVVLALIASIGNVMLCHHKARSIADLAAFNAAYALWNADTSQPCALAEHVASANGASMIECEMQDDDVRLIIAVTTQVPLAPKVTQEARAGPIACE
ncbi:oppa3 [Bifidobacterium saguini DSM 23967]|nr:oppa3 [Bifidobacterium saguini DSM 23967]PLS25398.1 oppa3 [Bifidobacterium imperatoris]